MLNSAVPRLASGKAFHTGAPSPDRCSVRIPVAAATVHGDDALRFRFGGQHVDHQIKPRAARQSVNRREPHDGRCETVVGHVAEYLFGGELGMAVERNRFDPTPLVERFFAGPVYRACAGKNEPPHAVALGQLGDHACR